MSRGDLIRSLCKLGFEGPYRGTNHDYLLRNDAMLRIPDESRENIDGDLLIRLLRQAGVSREEWRDLRQPRNCTTLKKLSGS